MKRFTLTIANTALVFLVFSSLLSMGVHAQVATKPKITPSKEQIEEYDPEVTEKITFSVTGGKVEKPNDADTDCPPWAKIGEEEINWSVDGDLEFDTSNGTDKPTFYVLRGKPSSGNVTTTKKQKWNDKSSPPREVTTESLKAEVRVAIVKLETEAVAEVPSDRTRKIFGIGEKVKITISPSQSAKWEVGSGGTLDQKEGSEVELSIGHEAKKKIEVTATLGKKKLKVQVESILPTGLEGTKLPICNGGINGSVNMWLNMVFQPTTVSFANLEFKEIPNVATKVTGYFADKKRFTPDFTTKKPGIITLGHDTLKTYLGITKNNEWMLPDQCALNMPAPWSEGHFEWKIPIRVRVKDTTKEVTPFTIYQKFDIIDDTGKCSVWKVDVSYP